MTTVGDLTTSDKLKGNSISSFNTLNLERLKTILLVLVGVAALRRLRSASLPCTNYS